MTIIERVNKLKENWPDMDADSIDKLVIIAYYMGREQAIREYSDKVRLHLSAQKKRASECRYHIMVESIVGPETYIYSPDYAGDVTATFGSDETGF